MKIATAAEMQKLDYLAINQLGIPGVVLMENAGLQVVKTIKEVLRDVTGKRVVILAGKGNNGGDGFVIARHLFNLGAEVKVLLLCIPSELKGDAKVNYDILQRMGHKVYAVANANSLNIVRIALMYADLIVDAIYGTGFRGEVSEHIGKIIDMTNEVKKTVIAVDIPSGVEADSGKVYGPAIRADHTVTFVLPKLGLYIEPGAAYTGKLHLVDISIPKALIEGQPINSSLITSELVRGWMPLRPQEGHKGTFGRVFILAGSRGMTGAAALTGEGVLRVGAGLVTLGVPKSLNGIMEVKLTEVMTKPLPETEDISFSPEGLSDIIEIVQDSNALAIGPGISRQLATGQLIKNLLPQLKVPTVLDADALYALSDQPELLREAQAPVVITPHPGEMSTLLGISIQEVQENRVEVARRVAKEWQVIVVLKGAKTVVAGPQGELYLNITGNPGMATGGTGDVLTGMVAGLLGQGLNPVEAASVAVYLHGLAGDRAMAEMGMAGLVAGDLLRYLPKVIKEFEMMG